MMKRNLSFVLGLLLVLSLSFVLANPNGADVTPGVNETAPADPAGSVDAVAGNLTELTLTGVSTTQTWQGYFGNVSGAIELTDASNNTMYNWSLASPSGEVYASTASSLTWSSIDCFNVSDSTDVSTLETAFGIDSGDADGVDETFTLSNHAEFFTGSKQFTSGNCSNTQLYNDAAVGTFDEVLMTDGVNTIFVSLLLEDITGFDSVSHDFQMLVLEDGHDGDTDVTTYNFWVELE